MLLLLHIWIRSLVLKKKCSGIRQKLHNAKDLEFAGNTELIYLWILDGPSKRLNAMSVVPGLIAFNAEWAARLALADDPIVMDAFRLTAGHELMHQEGDYSLRHTSNEDRRFVNWVSEVHADYGGTVLALNGDVQKAVTAMKYKARDYKNDKDHKGHPSWKHRTEYLENGEFNKELIRKIADDAGCVNNELIDNISNYYKPIVLKR